jgi:PTS system mannose-specific IID component
MAEEVHITKGDRIKVWWRSTFLQGSWNYERMQNGGWAYTLIPALKRLYHTKEDRAAALKRHLEFFNTHPYLASPSRDDGSAGWCRRSSVLVHG